MSGFVLDTNWIHEMQMQKERKRKMKRERERERKTGKASFSFTCWNDESARNCAFFFKKPHWHFFRKISNLSIFSGKLESIERSLNGSISMIGYEGRMILLWLSVYWITLRGSSLTFANPLQSCFHKRDPHFEYESFFGEGAKCSINWEAFFIFGSNTLIQNKIAELLN